VVDVDTREAVTFELDRSLTSNRTNAELSELLMRLMSAVTTNDLGQPSAMWVSAAGYAAPTRSRLEKLFRAAAGDFSGPVGLANDAVSLLLAHEPGVVAVVAGTGSVAMARTSEGNVIVRGGDEWVVADYGSAFWLGLNGVRAAYQALEGAAETALLGCLIEHYKPLRSDEDEDPRETVSEIARDLARAGTNTKPVIASFARQVTRQAELGDEPAQRIVRAAVDDLAAAAARVYRQLNSRVPDQDLLPRFVVSGSVAFNSRYYSESFTAALDQFLFDVRESLGSPIDVSYQLNGIGEGIELAERLLTATEISDLDPSHPYSLLRF